MIFKYPFQDTVVNTLTYCLPIYYRILFENSLLIGICGGTLVTLTHINSDIMFKNNESSNITNDIITYTHLSTLFIVSSTSITFGTMFIVGLPPIISVPIIFGGYCIRYWYLDNFSHFSHFK